MSTCSIVARLSPVTDYPTSSYLLPRALCGDLRFRDDNPHDDWDFLCDCQSNRPSRVETVPEILVRIYVDDTRPSLSKSGSLAGFSAMGGANAAAADASRLRAAYASAWWVLARRKKRAHAPVCCCFIALFVTARRGSGALRRFSPSGWRREA